MTLKIENLRLDKEQYIFWKDKEMKVSFNLSSNDNNESKINDIKIIYWVWVYISWKESIYTNKEFILKDNFSINSFDSEIFHCIIPIQYPNIDASLNNNDSLKKIKEFYDRNKKYTHNINYNISELKNYIKIITDVQWSFLDCKEEIFPVVTYVKNEIQYENNIKWLSNKNKSDAINIWLANDCFVSKSFYEYIINNYKIVKFIDFLKRKIKINIKIFTTDSFIIIFLPLFVIIWIIIMLNSLYLWIVIMALVFSLLWIILFITLQIKKIKESIIDIKFNDSEIIKNAIKTSSLKLSDIFKNVNINYTWIYICNFEIHVDYFLQIFNHCWTGRHRIMTEYISIIDSYKVWSYYWNNLTYNTIIPTIENLNTKIKPDIAFLGTKSTILCYWKAFINCKIRYSFTSPEIFNRDWEILFLKK